MEAVDVTVNKEKANHDLQQPDQQDQRTERPRVKGIICTGGMRFTAKWLIAESSYAPDHWIAYGKGKLYIS